MKVLVQESKTFGQTSPEANVVRTTLYDLIDAMADGTEPTDEGLIVAAVLDLTKSAKMKWTRPRRAIKLLH
jgi:hypothetical protein